MTEFFDLSTLSALGQHFSTVEDVAELKTMLMKVQNDLSAIKGFLTDEYGADFSNNVAAIFTSKNKVIPVPVIRRISASATSTAVNGGDRDEQLKLKQVPLMNKKPTAYASAAAVGGENLSKPPPLLRFRGGDIVANGNEKLNIRSGVSSSKFAGGGGSLAGVKKPGRFQRNFLSMSSLKSSTGGAGAGLFKSRSIMKTIVGSSNSSYGSGISRNGNVVKVESESSSDIQEESFTPEVKQNTVSVYNARSLSNGSYNLAEVNMEDIDEGAEGENYDDDDDAGQLEEDENVEYVMDEGNDQNGYDESAYMEIPDGSYNYDEDYSVDYGSDGLEMIDVRSNSNFAATSRNSSANGNFQERATSKRAQQRRVTLPDGDASIQKECKVCHEAFPSNALFDHVINTHYNGEVPTCQICKKTFTYRQGLISHMRYHDAEKYDKACSYCGKRFILKSDVTIHERRLHTGERPYQCPAPDCNQGFVRRYCLLTHVKTNHGEPLMSQIKAEAGKRRKSS